MATPTRRRKRGAEEARQEVIAASRALLLADGPAAITLTAVGKRIGMSHTNVLHHFGTAADLRSALMGSMIHDLTLAIGDAVAAIRSNDAAPRELVDRVFEAFDAGGAGQLAAWIALTGETAHLAPVRAAVHELVEAVDERLPGDTARVRQAVLLIAICAFGDAVIGPDFRAMVDQPDDAVRGLTLRILTDLLIV